MEAVKKVIILFKTHLDIGFTGLAQQITEHYFQHYIPKALDTAAAVNTTENRRFVWTTGSWLIHAYLEQAAPEERQRVEEGIRSGALSWHGLPFTTHSELMDPTLFRHGLSISQALDQRFGRATIGAKMTDVPGHTRGIVPLLAEAGIEFLHIGVNPASTPPDVPSLFVWKDEPSGKRVTVMYHKGGYGDFSPIPGTGIAVYFAHTNDNLGPQTSEEVFAVYRRLEEEYPDAELVAGDLNDVALAVRPIADTLPTVTAELGDTWIHGGATDPKKLSQFRSLLRLRRSFSQEQQEAMDAALLLVPEHTWGLDEKTFLADHTHFSKPAFQQLRQTPQAKQMEASWEEQRAYLERAVTRLNPRNQLLARSVMAEYRIPQPDLTAYTRLHTPTEPFSMGESQLAFDGFGQLILLNHCGRPLADRQRPLGGVYYEVFSPKDFARFDEQYLISDEEWAKEDFGKIGLGDAAPSYQQYRPQLDGVYQKDDTLYVSLRFPAEACERYGAPRKLGYFLTLSPQRLSFDLAFWEKDPSRIPEALWFSFSPLAKGMRLHKLGCLIDPMEVADNGNKRLHGVESGVLYDDLQLQSLDAALVGVGGMSLLNFHNAPPEPEKGSYWCLYNNIWGTNFPMWYGEDARFRFHLIPTFSF